MGQSDTQRWQRRKAERPGEIIQAALDLFTEKGFAATRLDEVAKHAGVSKGTLYLYFDNKEALFKEVVQAMVLPELARAEKEIQQYQGTATELLKQMVYQWWQAVGETHLCGLPKLVISEAGNFPELARFYNDHVVTRARMLIARIISLGVEKGEFRKCDIQLTARLLMAPVVYATIWKQSLQAFDDPNFDVHDLIDHHIEIFLNGLLITRSQGTGTL